MPQRVQVTYKNTTITICAKEQVIGESVDISGASFAETTVWSTATIQKTIAALDAMASPQINCQQGMNRSPTMTVLYLWSKGGTLAEALGAVTSAYAAVEDAHLGIAKVRNLLAQALLAYVPKEKRGKRGELDSKSLPKGMGDLKYKDTRPF